MTTSQPPKKRKRSTKPPLRATPDAMFWLTLAGLAVFVLLVVGWEFGWWTHPWAGEGSP